MVSIIVPVNNAEKTVARCIESALMQRLPQKEIILINDGSEDESLAILRQYEEKYPEISVVDKPNGGVSDARNAGLKVATGDFVTFIDSDDWIHPKYLETLLNACVNNNTQRLVVHARRVN